MCKFIILHLLLALFGAEWHAKNIIGTIPSYSVATRDSTQFSALNVAESQLLWSNFQQEYLISRGYLPSAEGYAVIKCDNPWVHYTGLSISDTIPVKLHVLSARDCFYYIETIKPLR